MKDQSDWRWREVTTGGKLHAFDRAWKRNEIRSACGKAVTERHGLKQEPATASVSPSHRCKVCSKMVLESQGGSGSE